MKIFGTKVIMAVLLMAVLPFSDLRADESVNPGLDAKAGKNATGIQTVKF